MFTEQDAISSLAGNDLDYANHIWDDPTPEQLIAIWKIVTQGGLIDSTEFFWGCSGSQWAWDVETEGYWIK